MRKKLALATIGAALVASFGPVSSASAICIPWYYELTGQCSPCHTAGHGINRANSVLQKLGSPVEFADLHCLQ